MKPKSDYLMLLGIVIIVLVGIFLISFYFNFKTDSCQTNPLVFGSKQMEETFDGTFYGVGYLGTKESVYILNFNSTNSYWLKS